MGPASLTLGLIAVDSTMNHVSSNDSNSGGRRWLIHEDLPLVHRLVTYYHNRPYHGLAEPSSKSPAALTAVGCIPSPP